MKSYKKLSRWAREHDMGYLAAWRMAKTGQIETETLPTGVIRVVENEPEPNRKEKVVVYARVSSTVNKANLESQAKRLVDYCVARGYGVSNVVTEFGSGLNDKRPKWRKLLTDSSITRIVVEHRYRFTRFGFDAFKAMLETNGVTLEAVNEATDDKEDLVQDFVSIITSYCAKIYGHRRSKRNTERLIKELSEVDRKDDTN